MAAHLNCSKELEAEIVQLMLIFTSEANAEAVEPQCAGNLVAETSEPMTTSTLPSQTSDDAGRNMSIVRQLARQHYLCGKSGAEAAKIDSIIDGLSEWNAEKYKDACDEQCFTTIQKAISGRNFLVGDDVTAADIVFFGYFTLRSRPVPLTGYLTLQMYIARLSTHPQIAPWYKKYGHTKDRDHDEYCIFTDSSSMESLPAPAQWWIGNTNSRDDRSTIMPDLSAPDDDDKAGVNLGLSDLTSNQNNKNLGKRFRKRKSLQEYATWILPSTVKSHVAAVDAKNENCSMEWWLNNTECRDDRSTIIPTVDATDLESPSAPTKKKDLKKRVSLRFFKKNCGTSCKF